MTEGKLDLLTRVTGVGADSILVGASIIRSGGLVAFPTETVYGLGADATNPLAVAKLYAAKGRPSFNPLISHVIDQSAAEKLGIFSTNARKLALAFWPGPLTLVVPKSYNCDVCELALSGLETIAIRVPSHPVARVLLEAINRPVVAPSANRSGKVSPTISEHVSHDLSGRIDLILDGGRADIGLESTIVYCSENEFKILRPGGISSSLLNSVIKNITDVGQSNDKLIAPGMLSSHYAPNAFVRLNADTVEFGEALLSFGEDKVKNVERAHKYLNLSPSSNLVEAAANLFQYLRALDAEGVRMIAVVPIPNIGIGEAINDRLRRAASPR
ncbi:MAG: L-threonylcarbamoyladenylate synthase [Hyphomicrobiales bacterium]